MAGRGKGEGTFPRALTRISYFFFLLAVDGGSRSSPLSFTTSVRGKILVYFLFSPYCATFPKAQGLSLCSSSTVCH